MSEEFDFLKKMIPALNEKGPRMMAGSFASKGSAPYFVVGMKDGMQVGVKFHALLTPFVACAGLRVRVQWEPGNSDVQIASDKLKLALTEGSTPSNGSTIIMLPFIKVPFNISDARLLWAAINGTQMLADYVGAWLVSAEINPEVTAEQIVNIVTEGFNEQFPDLPIVPGQENPEVLNAVTLFKYMKKAHEEFVAKNSKKD